MLKKKQKIITGLLISIVVFGLAKISYATDYTSAGFTVTNPVLDQGTSSSSSTNFGLGQSLNQNAIGKSSSASFQIWSGFQYFFKVNANVLTATPGNSQVSLSWTVPQTYLGVTVGGYEVGTGTTSGSYVFESVGNVTSFIKNGLTNGTPYFFIVKAKAVGGLFLVYSNEATATPTGSGGGGGGGGGNNTSVIFNGIGYPNSTVTLLQDGNIVSTASTASGGTFSIAANNLTAGTYTFGLYSTDSAGTKSATVNFQRTVLYNTISTVNDVIMPPSLATNLLVAKQGQTVTLSGYTGPNSAVTLQLQSGLTRSGTSDANGFYKFDLDTTSMAKGVYSAFTKSVVQSKNSPASSQVSFQIGDTTTPPPGTCGRSDLNCDGKVDLIDFSILLYYWNKPPGSNAKVDINKSGIVDLTDLSIMLYDWTG